MTKSITEYIILTELWNNGEYLKVGKTIKSEKWSACRMAEFCAYFVKYVGASQLNSLHRFI
jgi:hypothetical protein